MSDLLVLEFLFKIHHTFYGSENVPFQLTIPMMLNYCKYNFICFFSNSKQPDPFPMI